MQWQLLEPRPLQRRPIKIKAFHFCGKGRVQISRMAPDPVTVPVTVTDPFAIPVPVGVPHHPPSDNRLQVGNLRSEPRGYAAKLHQCICATPPPITDIFSALQIETFAIKEAER